MEKPDVLDPIVSQEHLEAPPRHNHTIGLALLTVILASSVTFLISQREPSTSLLPAPSSIPQSSPRTVPSDSLKPTPSPQASLTPIPASKTISGGTHTFQTFNNCGPAALSMTLSLFGITESQQTLGRELRPYQNQRGDNDDKSVTLQEVSARAKEYGFLTYLRPGGKPEMIEQFIALDIPVIARTWLTPTEDIGHFRVIKGYNQSTQTFIQDDSLQGKNLSYSYSDFGELWSAFNYEFLVLVPQEKQAQAERILNGILDEKQAWQNALQLAKVEAERDPNNVYPLFNQSVALYHLGEYEESVRIFEQVRDRLPFRMLWYQLEPILSYYRLGEYDIVLRMADGILNNQNRAYSELHQLKGDIFELQGNGAAAESAYAAARLYNTTEYWKVNLQ